jgi:2-dehydropantoate 2-reductase
MAAAKPQVLVIGTGGVGTIVAFELALVEECSVSIVVRRDYAKVSQDGYEIHSCVHGDISGWKPDKIYATVEAAGENQYDFVVVSTKNLPDIAKVEELIEPVVTEGKTAVVMMQNGFDIGRPVIKKYPKNVCLSAVSHIGSHNHSGIVTQTQKDKCLLSYFFNDSLPIDTQEQVCRAFIDLLSHPQNDIIYFPDAKWYRYRKLVYNATLNTVAAVTRLDTGRLLESGGLQAVSIPAMREVIKIAKADGVELPEDVINMVVHSDDGDWFKPSMLVDVEKGNPIELEVILGNLLTVAKELNVETPILSLLYELLKVVQYGLKEKAGYFQLPEERPYTDEIYK